MEETFKKLKKQEETVRTIVLIFLGAGINFTLGYGFMLSTLYALIQSPMETLTSSIPQSTSILAISYIIIGIVYSTTASLGFQPKRIISPLYTQLVTASFVPFLIIYVVTTVSVNPPIDLVMGSVIALFTFMLSLVLFFVTGIGQTMVVKALVGLNGTEGDVNSFGLLINAKVEDVLKVLKATEVREALQLNRREDKKIGEHSYILRTLHYNSQQFFIALIADSDSVKTQLATVSYTQGYYGISKSGNLIETQRKNTIKKALRIAGYTFIEDNSDSPAKLLAYTHGIAVTESRLLKFKSLPPHTKAIFAGVIIMLLIVTAIWKFGYMPPDIYETFLIMAGFALIVDLVPLLRIRGKEQSAG